MMARNGVSIEGGHNYTTTGACSSILGGSGNNDGGLNNVFIAGNGITAVTPNTFHVEYLNAVNTPVAGPFPSGTMMYKTFATLLPTDRVLVIAP